VFARLQLRNALLLAIVLVPLIATACAPSHKLAMVPASMLPDYVRTDSARVQEAYRFAAANQDELAHYPCYCGCDTMGHTSNLSCYVSEVGADGSIVFEHHAVGCSICVDITQDVMRLKRRGQSPGEIRTYIDATYSPFGPSTDTPLP
jgi:hypothetical protein